MEWADKPAKRVSQKPFTVLDGRVMAGYRGEWQNFGKNELDYAVIESAMVSAYEMDNVQFKTVRAVFLERQALYPDSWFFEHAHVAIAVRPNFDAIVGELEVMSVE
ncbi:MAG: hypothetical protein U1E87_01620 [Alphaproteobacteria bacterium]